MPSFWLLGAFQGQTSRNIARSLAGMRLYETISLTVKREGLNLIIALHFVLS